MESTCCDCGAKVLRSGKRGTLPKRCKPCSTRAKTAATHAYVRARSEHDAEYRACMKQKGREQSRRLRAAMSEEDRAAARAKQVAAYRAKVSDPEVARAMSERNRTARLARYYGITVMEYDQLFAAQGARCAICGGTDPKAKYDRWHVDHDHVTGVVRGILCSPCNVGLGHFGDDPDRIAAAAAYLRR